MQSKVRFEDHKSARMARQHAEERVEAFSAEVGVGKLGLDAEAEDD